MLDQLFIIIIQTLSEVFRDFASVMKFPCAHVDNFVQQSPQKHSNKTFPDHKRILDYSSKHGDAENICPQPNFVLAQSVEANLGFSQKVVRLNLVTTCAVRLHAALRRHLGGETSRGTAKQPEVLSTHVTVSIA